MLGIIISIIASGIIAYLIARWQIKKTRIDHYFINSYDIGKGLTDVFPEFSLHYGDEVLNKNVMVLQGGIMNTDRNDIGKKNETTEINIKLPEGCNIIDIDVSTSCEGLKVNGTAKFPNNDGTKDKRVLGFEIDGIMKSKEWFNYTAIFETSGIIGNLYKQLDTDNRLENITINNLYLGPNYKNKLSSSKTSVVLAIIGLPLFISFLVHGFLHPEKIMSLFDNSPSGSGLWIFLLVFFAFFIVTLILSSFLLTVLIEKFGRRGRIVIGIMKKKKNSDDDFFESLYIP